MIDAGKEKKKVEIEKNLTCIIIIINEDFFSIVVGDCGGNATFHLSF